tara:strand:- start:154 stop:378 length:225 start_codon:yes stop_codon:yes gene_type:complete
MENFIANLKTQLLEQKKELGTNIKNGEDNLLRTKEGFLKVEGALELINIIETELSKAKEAEKKTDEVVKEAVLS